MGGELTYPNTVPLVLTHSHIITELFQAILSVAFVRNKGPLCPVKETVTLPQVYQAPKPWCFRRAAELSTEPCLQQKADVIQDMVTASQYSYQTPFGWF